MWPDYPTAESLSEALEAVSGRIQRERMADILILNPVLAVKAVAFRRWQGHFLGVPITPWFMKLMLAAAADMEWAVSRRDMLREVFAGGRAQIHVD